MTSRRQLCPACNHQMIDQGPETRAAADFTPGTTKSDRKGLVCTNCGYKPKDQQNKPERRIYS